MFQITPYPVNYDHLLRDLHAVHAEQARLDALRDVFEHKKPARRSAKRIACSWIANTPKSARQTVPIARQTSYLREWAVDPASVEKTRQRRTRKDSAPEFKPRKAAKKKPISASKDSPVFAATDEQLATISRLWQTGATAKEIGGQVDMTYQAVSRLIRTCGMTRPEKPMRRGKATDAQIADVIRQRREGLAYDKISEAIGLSTWIIGKIARQHAQQAAQ